MLLCNDVSHGLGASLESALEFMQRLSQCQGLHWKCSWTKKKHQSFCITGPLCGESAWLVDSPHKGPLMHHLPLPEEFHPPHIHLDPSVISEWPSDVVHMDEGWPVNHLLEIFPPPQVIQVARQTMQADHSTLCVHYPGECLGKTVAMTSYGPHIWV